MKEIPLAQGKVALVDDEDYGPLVLYKWRAQKRTNQRGSVNWYAVRNVGRKLVGMHNAIMCPPKGLLVDHKDGNGLDCQRRNMRLATPAQNNFNAPKQRNNKSGFKGVYLYKRPATFPWRAAIRAEGKYHYLGGHSTAEAAARAYDAKAAELHGEFARLNFP